MKTWMEWPNVATIDTAPVATVKQPPTSTRSRLPRSPEGGGVGTGPINGPENVLWAWSENTPAGNKDLKGHKAIVMSAAWSKDGKLIVTGDADGVVIVWDAEKFKERSRLKLGGRVAALAVSADGKSVAAAVVPSAPAYGQGAYPRTCSCG